MLTALACYLAFALLALLVFIQAARTGAALDLATERECP